MGRTGKKGSKNKKKQKELPEDPTTRAPRSFIFRRGRVGHTVKQLVDDFREVMRPNTATNLKESSSNNIKDFIHVAGPLGVSHMVIFSATETGTYMRLVRSPHGPTLTFRVHNYSLMADVARLQQRPHSPSYEYKTAPLLIMNSFNGEEKQLKLMTIAFQNLFPTINVQQIHIDDCKRTVMLNYDKDTGRIDFRHYLVKVVPAGVSKSVKRVVQKRLESMDQFSDISDYVMRGAGASDSDAEDMATADSQLTLPQKTRRGEVHQQQSAVRLQEIGPRMELELVKIEEGVCDGTVLYHAFVKKSFAEMEALAKRKEEQRKLREARRKAQEARVQEKLKNKVAKTKQPRSKSQVAGDDNEQFDSAPQPEDVEDDDIEWYRQEVGEEPDKEEAAELKAASTQAPTRSKFNPLYRKRKKPDASSAGAKGKGKPGTYKKPKLA